MGTGMEEGGMMEDSFNLGIIPRSIQEMFARLEQQYGAGESSCYQIYVSFLEIYNEVIKDLLSPSSLATTSNRQLVIREDASGEIYLAGCIEERIRGPNELYECLRKGSLCRTTGSTDMNLTSSRSHAIFSIILRQQKAAPDDPSIVQQTVSKFHFVDLAGSERLKRTKAVGSRAKEAISINGGLLALGNVISALSSGRRNGHIPYRDSKLTRLLQNSLGGNSQTLMMACVSPAESNQSESLNTLQYANRAKNIRNRVQVNVDANGTAFEITQLKKLVMALKQELFNTRNQNSSSSGGSVDAVQALKAAKIQAEKKLSEYISENTDIRLKLELVHTHLGNASLDNILTLPPICALREQIVQLKSQLAMADIRSNSHAASSSHERRHTVPSNIPSLIMPEDLLYTLTNPEELRNRVAMLQNELLDKVDLHHRYDKTREEYQVIKAKYEEKITFLNDTIATLKKERDNMLAGRKSIAVVNSAAVSGGMSRYSRDKYEERIKILTREKEQLKASYDELSNQMKGKSSHDTNLTSLKNMIQTLKHEKIRLTQSMTDEMVKLKANLDLKEADLKELKLLEKQAQDDVKKYKKYYEYQKSLNVKKSIMLSGAGNATSLIHGLKRRKSDNSSSIVTAAALTSQGTESESGEPDDPMEVDHQRHIPMSLEALKTFKDSLEDELFTQTTTQEDLHNYIHGKLDKLNIKDLQALLQYYVQEKTRSQSETLIPSGDFTTGQNTPTSSSPSFTSKVLLSPTRKNAFIFSRTDINPPHPTIINK